MARRTKTTPPPADYGTTVITLSLVRAFLPNLQKLPWHKSLEEWTRHDAKFLQIRSGLSRHIVRFIESKRRAFAIKETTGEVARKEIAAYRRLKELGIPALFPVGTVVRGEAKIVNTVAPASPVESPTTGYVITSLLEYSLPNLYLFKRAFKNANRRRIWDAIVTLFVRLHCAGVYWGDASLSNMMIVFANEHYPEIGVRTVLRAVLADAETIEFHPHLSPAMRRTDIEFFLESMAWTEEDFRASGLLRDPLMTDADQQYILQRYADLFEIEREEQKFEFLTTIDVDALLGPFERRGQSKALLKHIYEHRWYLGERLERDVPIGDAAVDWYMNVFKPVLLLFDEFEILDEFPDATAASLYLDIMLHKYYLSEQCGRDVGLITAFESYTRKFQSNDRTRVKMNKVATSMRSMFPLSVF
jgi:hypothetical protein